MTNSAQALNKAIFLDRDGVINPDPGYIKDPTEISPYPYAAQAIKIFNELGYKVIVVSNQSGIARGYFSLADLENIHAHLLSALAEGGAKIDKIYFAPYHIDGKVKPYNVQHQDRKPDIGMFIKACNDFDLDPSISYMIGDRLSDMIFAKNAGLSPILVLSGDGKADFRKRLKDFPQYQPQFIAQDILAAALLIKNIDNGFK